MNPLRRFLILCAVLSTAATTLSAQSAGGASAAEIKRITDRYALTRTRINQLLSLRLNPAPLPANPANPFYQPPVEALTDPGATNQGPVEVPLPDTSDISDIDILRKYSATLKVGGLITRNGVPHLTVNNTASKVGDVITVGNRDHPIYLKLVSLNPSEFTLGLNEATLVVPIRK